MGLLDQFGDFIKTPEGIGLLSGLAGYAANAQRGTPINNLGRGAMTGVMGYNNAINQQEQLAEGAQMRDYRKTQMEQLQAAALDKQRRALMMQNYRDTLPEADRGIFDMAPDKYIENMPRFQKQQLVEVADPNEPLRTQKQWMRPGETSGVVAGSGAMPEILDPRVQAARRAIAAAGASRTNVNMPPMESEEQKALGKDLAEQYSTTQKTAMSSSGLLNKLNRAEQLMQGINTGKLAPAANEVAAVAESFGIKLDPKLPQKQAFSALSNELALRAKNAGGENLMPGAMSEADRVFLQQMSPSMSNTPEGNRLIIETNKRLAKRDVEIAKMAREYRNKNRTLNGFAEELANFSDKNPLFKDIQPAAASSSIRSQADAIIGGR